VRDTEAAAALHACSSHSHRKQVKADGIVKRGDKQGGREVR